MHNLTKKVKEILYLLTVKVILLCILIVLPLNIMLIFFTQKMMNRADEQVRLSLQNIADVYMNTLDSRIGRTDYYLYTQITDNPDLLTLRTAKSETEYISVRMRCFQDMYNEISLTSNCDACFLYIEEKEDYIISLRTRVVNQENDFRNYLENNLKTARRWVIEEIDGTTYAVRTANWANLYYGAFINLDLAAQEVNDSIHYNDKQVSFVDKGRSEQLDNYIAVVSSSKLADFELGVQVARTDIRARLSFWERGQIIIVFLFTGMLPALYLAIKRWILKPLQELNRAHHELEVGNEAFRILNPGSSMEFHEAYRSFNEMADNIHSLKLENMEKELAGKQLQLTNLQLQVRPHFLLNTFNLIYNLATEKQVDNIKELVLYLSAYFRHIFRSGKELELFSKELELIEGYIKASMIRYPDMLGITCQIDPDVYLVRIPPLLIHNFIENAVNHAMVKNQKLHIMLSAEYAEKQVTFMISDDGTGMSEEEVDLINSEKYFEDEERVHVGLRNSVTRLKYFYGNGAKIKVESEPGCGTLFTISFPYNLEEED